MSRRHDLEYSGYSVLAMTAAVALSVGGAGLIFIGLKFLSEHVPYEHVPLYMICFVILLGLLVGVGLIITGRIISARNSSNSKGDGTP